MLTTQSLSRRLEFYTLEELFRIGLDRARALQSYYENWDESNLEDVTALELALGQIEESIRNPDSVQDLHDLSENAYSAAARAAAVYRHTRCVHSKFAQYAGVAIHLLSDALVERDRDQVASRDYVIQSIVSTFKAESEGLDIEPKTVIAS